MSDPNHPIFKQFTELDPSIIVIRDTPHPDSIWSQPPVMGTLTPGYAQPIPGQPYMRSSDEPQAPPTGDCQAHARPQRWQPEFPGLWDDIPGSGTIATNNGLASSGVPHSRSHSLPQSQHDITAPSTERPEGSVELAGGLSEHQSRPENSAGNRSAVEPKHH